MTAETMKTSWRAAALVAVMVCSAGAFAQAPDPSGTPDTPPGAAPVTSPTGGTPGISTATAANSARSSKLIGTRVYQGDTSVGQIEDVLVDLQTARVTAVVLSVGGFAGIGNKLVSVKPEQIVLDKEAKFTVAMTQDQLKAAPAFDFSAKP